MSLGPLMVGLSGPELLAEEEEILRHPHVGGVILFSRNYDTPQQVEHLAARIHALREPHLLIAVDHEGGRVQRFRNGFTLLPPARRIGEAYDRDADHGLYLAETMGWLMAAELRAVGIDLSFAPVVDVDRGASTVIGDRAFHSDPEVVTRLALSYEKGMLRAGMAATAKHFPGHGGIREDSHNEIAVDERPYEELLREDILPFRRLIHHGTVAVMAAHVIYKAVDARPAGFSSVWMQQVLRRELAFQGVIFSDDLYMEGAAVMGDIPDRAQAALDAGCDMVLLCRPVGEPGTLVTLDRITPAVEPVSHLRLIRLHGRKHVTRAHLPHEPAWQEAVRLGQQLNGQQSLDLT
jgi:beta-N-acetylhexosaminidase